MELQDAADELLLLCLYRFELRTTQIAVSHKIIHLVSNKPSFLKLTVHIAQFAIG